MTRLIAEPPFEDCLHVARNLRDRDREELCATTYDETPEFFARTAANTGAMRWCAYADDGEPIALQGVFPRWPGVWTAWAYGTDRWKEAVLALTRNSRRFVLPALYNANAHRVDAFSLASHTDARDWLSFLGAKPTNRLDKWGKNGEDFTCYVWTRETMRRLILEMDTRKQNASR